MLQKSNKLHYYNNIIQYVVQTNGKHTLDAC